MGLYKTDITGKIMVNNTAQLPRLGFCFPDTRHTATFCLVHHVQVHLLTYNGMELV